MRQVVYNVLIEIGIETKARSSHCKRNRENEVNETKAKHTKSRHRRRARQRPGYEKTSSEFISSNKFPWVGAIVHVGNCVCVSRETVEQTFKRTLLQYLRVWCVLLRVTEQHICKIQRHQIPKIAKLTGERAEAKVTAQENKNNSTEPHIQIARSKWNHLHKIAI